MMRSLRRALAQLLDPSREDTRLNEYRIARLRLGPNDVLVVKCRELLRVEQANMLKAKIKLGIPPGVRVLMIDKAIDLEVLERPDYMEIPAQPIRQAAPTQSGEQATCRCTTGPYTDIPPDGPEPTRSDHLVGHVVHRTSDGRTWYLASVHGDLCEGDPFANLKLFAGAADLFAAAEAVSVNALDVDASADVRISRELFNDLCGAVAKAGAR